MYAFVGDVASVSSLIIWRLQLVFLCIHDALGTTSKLFPLCDFYSYNYENIAGLFDAKLCLTLFDFSETLNKSVATESIVALSNSWTCPIPKALPSLPIPLTYLEA